VKERHRPNAPHRNEPRTKEAVSSLHQRRQKRDVVSLGTTPTAYCVRGSFRALFWRKGVARLAIVALCAGLLLGGLGAGELFRNEGLRARLAFEILSERSWLVPMLYGEPHLTKPPGMSVLIALVSLPFGEVTTISARIPSVLAGAAAILLVGWAVGRCHGARAGWLAAAILPCAPLWLDRVPSAEIDLVQLAWVSGAILCVLPALEAGRSPIWWLGSFLCVAGGFFTKWTAPAFFYLTLVPFLWWRGQLRSLLAPGHLLGALLASALGLAWLLHVGQTVGWSLLIDTVAREALLRFSPGHHPRPYPWDEWITFPIGFIAGCLPWSLFAVISLRPNFGRLLDDRQRALWQLAICWVGSSLLFWTVVPGHRPRHLLPAQPGLAILAALVCLAWLEGKLSWPRSRLAPRGVVCACLAMGLAAKLVFVGWIVPARQGARASQIRGEQLARIVPEDEMLHLVQLKDDGLLFYYGRPARRIQFPRPGAWCLMHLAEWSTWPADRAEVQARLTDGHGDPLVLVRCWGKWEPAHARSP
jgi:4-amino-4-deoxy-L-arabinose transferase-like glycosyltransferase